MASELASHDDKDHVPVADGLRGFAMLLVVGNHVVIAIPAVLGQTIVSSTFFLGGALAVPFFFVISGFLLHLPAARHAGDLGSIREYIERRVVRLMPAYWLMLAGLLLVWPYVFEVVSPAATKDGVRALLVHAVLLQQLVLGPVRYGFISDVGFAVNGAVWSLTPEAVFYAFLPIVCRVFHRHPRASLAIALAVTIAWRFGARHTNEIASILGLSRPEVWLGDFLFQQPPGHAWAFAVGMFGAECYVRWRERPFFGSRAAACLRVACELGLLASVYLAGMDAIAPTFFHDYPRDLVPAVFLATLLVVASFGPKRAAWPYSNAVSRFLGDSSYGAFLWHMILIQISWRAFKLNELGVTRGTLALAVMVVPTALGAGYLSRRFVERPLVRFLRGRQAKRGAVVGA